MSRRKQSRPRPVLKVSADIVDDLDLTERYVTSEAGSRRSPNVCVDDEDDDIVVSDRLVIALSPKVDVDATDNDQEVTGGQTSINHIRPQTSHTTPTPVFPPPNLPPPHLPPNFLHPSPSSSAFTAPTPPCPSHPFDVMARRKNSPKNIHWNPQKCQLCHSNRLSDNTPKSPVEKEEYFIDGDGTLTIKNGVCPRRLALRLFGEVETSHKKYEDLLGDNLVKFLLNLKQIVDKHRDICPDEKMAQIELADKVLLTHIESSPLARSVNVVSRKRPHEQFEKSSLLENFIRQRNQYNLTEAGDFDASDSFQQVPQFPTNRVSILPEVPSPKLPSVIDGADGLGGNKGASSDYCSSEESSRVASPSPSISSMTSDAAKQMSNTKRGSKILPVSSTDGQTRYLCPVCSLELSNDHELTVHIRSHNQTGQQSVPNTCTICNKTLSSQSSLDRHMLVHSGERPFKCKICDMSFTTNGNMHRHARIHEKNGLTTPKPQLVRRSMDSKSSSRKEIPMFPAEKASEGSPDVSETHFTTLNSDELRRIKGQQQQTALLQQYYNYFLPHHPAYPMFQNMQDLTNPPYSSYFSLMNMTNKIYPTKRPRLYIREPSPDLRAPQTYVCNVCDEVFTNQFSLESHIESHVIVDKKLEAEGGATCKVCKVVAKSEESLLLHTLTHHKEEEVLAEPDSKPGKKSPSSPSQSAASNLSNGNNSPGFQGLGFTSFTAKKFPLIAQTYCENLPGIKGSKFPVFKCQECDKEFPVEGAKDLHEVSHVPEEYTVCPVCDCHFTESSRLQEHMFKHVADRKFEDTQNINNASAHCLDKNYFLAQFSLIPKEDPGPAPVQENNSEDDVSVVSDNEESIPEEEEEKSQANCDSNEDIKPSVPVIGLTGTPSLPPSFLLHPSALTSTPNKTKTFLSQSGTQRQISHLPNTLRAPSPAPSNESDSDLRSHTSSLEGSMPPMFPCKYCDILLTSPQALKQHQRSHKTNSQFQCEVCNYSSTDKSTLQRHMRTHSGERPFKCGICEYSFTTKANCERHMKQKHGLEKDQLSDKLVCNKYNKSCSTSPTPSNGSRSDSTCQVCGVDFLHWRGLQQHHYVSPNCRMSYLCKLCKMSLNSKQSSLLHILKNHPGVPAQDCEKFIISIEQPPASPALVTPPPAHTNKFTPPSPINSPTEKLQVLSQIPTPDIKPLVGLLQGKVQPLLHRVEANTSGSDKPLDFSKQEVKRLSGEGFSHLRSSTGSRSSSVSFSEDDQLSEDLPIDLSLPRTTSAPSCRQGLKLLNQSHSGYPKQIIEGQGVTNNINLTAAKSSVQLTNSHLANFREISGRSLRSDNNNNNKLLHAVPTPSDIGNIPKHLSMYEKSQLMISAPKCDASGSVQTRSTSKHSAFPEFNSFMSGIPLLAAASSNSQDSTSRPKFIPVHNSKSLLPSSVEVLEKSLLLKAELINKEKSVQDVSFNKDSQFSSGPLQDVKETSAGKKEFIGASIVTGFADKKSKKCSSSESDSSCELASVKKILDATDAQKFQEFLMIPEMEDEQDAKSESVASSEDSNLSMENMYSNSQSFNSGLQGPRSDDGLNTKQDDSSSTSEEGKEKRFTMPPAIVNVALIDNELPAVFKDRRYKQDTCDPSNMSEQAIAKLIEKVAKENPSSPAKKKRNSYADSPHKFSCPYCPRCFPWLSSLNRHLLTHTGQKPFKCPRCPVTFSTKSNRERHLIRKHNVNMMDPASRSTMDRPYKCHVCVFSSFSTHSNLVKHYKDRHEGVSPPSHFFEAMDKSQSDGEGEDVQVNGVGPSYEDEEEYNNLVEMRGGLSDKEIMLQNYTQDSDSNHSSTNTVTLRDPHKKRNAIFNLNNEEEHANNKVPTLSNHISTLITKPTAGLVTRPGIDDTVLTDTMKNFLDKSVRQALEDSHRRALEEGSKFIITPAIERHLRHLPVDETTPENSVNQKIQCLKCDREFINHKFLIKHIKYDHGCDLPFKCYLCETSFTTRVECLQHQVLAHQAEWNVLKEKNEVGNVQVFATRLDKMIEKLSKKGRDFLEKQSHDAEVIKTLNKNKRNAASSEESLKTDQAEDTDGKLDDVMDCEDHNTDDNPDPGVLEEVITTDYLLRKVYCSLCPKRFWSLQDLKRHMRSHTGERPYRCDICFQKFTLKHSMNRHKAKHHPEFVDVPDGTSEEEESGGSDTTGQSKSLQRSLLKPGSEAQSDDLLTNDDNNNKHNKADTNDEDMLHNLLGVESSTIDQIFDAKDSAASILGV